MRLDVPRWLKWCWLALAAAMLVFAVRGSMHLGGEAGDTWFASYAYPAIKATGVAVIFARVFHTERQRAAFALVGLGFAFSLAGDIAWAVLYRGNEVVPVPSIADLFYITEYGFMGLAVVALMRGTRTRAVLSGLWLDGIVVALTLATVVGYFVLPPLMVAWQQTEPVGIVTNAAYALGDALVIAALVSTVALRNWRLDLRSGLLTVAFAAFVASDAFYLVQIANGTYRPSGIVDLGWLLACALGGVAAWTPEARAEDASATTRLSSVVPSLAGCAAIGLLLVDQVGPDTEWLLIPVAVIAALIFLRFTLISHDNHRLIAHNRTEAVTDALTGLANRRRLLEDLALAHQRNRVVILFDLDGFKSYNDTFGHPAGDALLQMIGRALAEAIPGEGRAYRLGGDEFCAVLPVDEDPDALGRRLASAMARDGHGFNIGASFGATTVPAGAPAPERTLGDADERLYVNKNRRRTPADEQSTEVLLAVLAERTPDLNDHAASVADLAAGVAERLGLDAQRAAHVRRAAALHDIGKMAIPDAILAKPGPLDESEWHLMRQHTVIGERILAAAPALRPVAEIVRASHERWDGRGYPDQVAGEDIPLGARIVFACDAFDAMTAERAYNRPRTPGEAVAELRACAGTQFDPAVVDALAAEIEHATVRPRGTELSPTR